jgi:threonyl-tRNA synthetase
MCLGRQCYKLGTIQVDYNLPERFDSSTYKGADDKSSQTSYDLTEQPFGSMER